MAVRIEEESYGIVKRHELRPDIWPPNQAA